MTRSRHRIKVALNEPANSGALVILAFAVLEAMKGNPWFPNPVPPLAMIRSASLTLQKLNAKAQGGPIGSREERNAARDKLVSHLQLLRAYVQWVAEQNPEHAPSIIESSGFSTGRRTIPAKAPFAVLPWRVSGTVKLVARAVAKVASYEWQYSADGGKTWIKGGLTLQAETTIPDLEPGKTYLFRFRPITSRGGEGDWCDPIAFLVR